jgi:hypothetical protein
MTEKTDADGLGAVLHDRNNGLQEYRRVSRPVRAAFYVPAVRHGRGRQTPGARGQVPQGGHPRPEPIYYCATGEEMPLFEPCKDRKDQRDI